MELKPLEKSASPALDFKPDKYWPPTASNPAQQPGTRWRIAVSFTGRGAARRIHRIWELGRLLFHDHRLGGSTGPPPDWAEQPSGLIAELESTAEGCRWLLDHWSVFRLMRKCRCK